MRGSIAWPCALVVAIALVAGCAPRVGPGSSSDDGSPDREELVVLAAASLRDALTEAASTYEAITPGVDIVLATGASSALRAQIQQGAPADLFLSADAHQQELLVEGGLVLGKPLPFARDTLELVVPAANPAGIASPADLARPGVRIITANEGVPIATYADRLVADLGRRPGYPAGFAAAYAANIVSREDDASSVLAKVRLGEADAAFVYRSSLRFVDDVTIIEGGGAPTTLVASIPAASPRPDLAMRFFDWLLGPVGAAILARHLFFPPL